MEYITYCFICLKIIKIISCVLQMVAACVLAIFGTIVMTVSKTSLLFLWACKPSTPTNQW